MSVYGDDHDGHVCERCDREYLLRDDAEPTRWCDECAQAIAADITERLAAAEREMGSERTNLVAWILRNMDDIACFWDDCNHDTRSECVVLIVKQYEAAKAGGVM